MISVRAVDKTYGDHPAVRGLDFEIAAGTCVGLLGLNGAGKSTTLKMLGCLLEPTAGQIAIRGMTARHDPQKIRAFVGYLPENPPLYGEMTARAYLTFAGRLRGMNRRRVQQRIDEVAISCDLQRVLDVQIESLSHGFQQRIGIAQAILHEPALLILDEPTQGLDPVQIAEVRALIIRLRGAHTIVLSTHILAEIEAVCDRILVLHEGRLAAQGTESELVARFGAAGGGIEVEVCGAETDLKAARTSLAETEPLPLRWDVRHEPDGVLRVQIDAGRDLRADLSRALISAGLDLLALRRSQSGLEAMFRRLGRDSGGDPGQEEP